MKNNILKGQLIAVFEKRMMMDCLRNGCTVVYVGDMTGMDNREAHMFINGMPLIPNVKAMQSLISGNVEEFRNEYYIQLCQDPFVMEYIETIVCALYQSKTIILYIPEEAVGFGYHQILFQFLKNMLGINVQVNQNTPFYFENTFTPQVLGILMKHKMIDEWIYLYLTPIEFMQNREYVKNVVRPSIGAYNNLNLSVDDIIAIRNQMEAEDCVIKPMITFS